MELPLLRDVPRGPVQLAGGPGHLGSPTPHQLDTGVWSLSPCSPQMLTPPACKACAGLPAQRGTVHREGKRPEAQVVTRTLSESERRDRSRAGWGRQPLKFHRVDRRASEVTLAQGLKKKKRSAEHRGLGLRARQVSAGSTWTHRHAPNTQIVSREAETMAEGWAHWLPGVVT